jgi:hypothetical protein
MRAFFFAPALLVAGAVAQAQAPVRGVAFIDLNGDGVRQANELPLQGMAVSNQDQVVLTDAGGAFTLPPGPGNIIFVSEPDGYRTVGKYWRAANGQTQPLTFAMKPSAARGSFTFVDASDTHISQGSLPQTQRFRLIVDSLKPDFVIIAGDLVKDALRVGEPEATTYYDLAAREFSAFKAPVWLVPGNHENFGIETQLSHVDPKNPLFGRAMYHQRFGPDYYSFTRGGIHFIGLNSVDISGTSYYGHVDSLQLEWLKRDLSFVPADMPVVTFNHIPLVSAMEDFRGYDDGPPAPTLITVNGKTSMRHVVSNVSDVLSALKGHHHVLAIGAHIHAGEKISFVTDGELTRFEQSPAIVGPSGVTPYTFPSGFILYTVSKAKIDAGKFVPVSAGK